MSSVRYLSFFRPHPLFKCSKFSLYKVVKTENGYGKYFIRDVYSNDVDVVKEFVSQQTCTDVILISFYGLRIYYVSKYKQFYNVLSVNELDFVFQKLVNNG